MVAGKAAEIGFANRNLDSWPGSPAAGDRYIWYSPDGSARLWTDKNEDLLTIGPAGDVSLTGQLTVAKTLVANDCVGIGTGIACRKARHCWARERCKQGRLLTIEKRK
jgi:hypothetical protein